MNIYGAARFHVLFPSHEPATVHRPVILEAALDRSPVGTSDPLRVSERLRTLSLGGGCRCLAGLITTVAKAN